MNYAMPTDINLFTAAMKTQFLNSMQAVGKPAPVDTIVTIVPSTARIENYAWMTPAPGISRYKGYRRLAKLSSIKYTVENYEYDGAFSVDLRDLEDDQVGGYKLRMKDLVEKAKAPFRSRLMLQFMAAGQTNVCFDGSYFYSTSHNIGGYSASSNIANVTGGGNLLTYTSASADGKTHCFTLSVTNGVLNPFMYQDRKQPQFGTDAGTPASQKAKRADYWIDLEAAAGHGYWWDSVMVKFVGTPTVLEAIAAIDAARQALRQFSLPVALPTDGVEYPHEQLEFSPSNVVLTASIGIETIMDRVLNESYYGISQAGSSSGVTPNNLYYKKFSLIVSNYLNSVT